MIQYCAEEQRERLERLEQILVPKGVQAIPSGLYPPGTKFGLQKFGKTGSLLTLLGDQTHLTHQVIKRTISYQSFLSWQQAYEQSEIWRQAGFNYVPLEPIIDFCKPFIQTISIDNSNKTDIRIDAYIQVLDCNLAQRIRYNNHYLPKLLAQKQAIPQVINTLGIDHGYPHEANFCIRFARSQDGSIDYNQCPRLYLIDWDRANAIPDHQKK